MKSLTSDFVIVVDNSFRKSLARNKKLDMVITKEDLPLGDRILTYPHLYEVKRIGVTIPEDAASAEFIGVAVFSKKGIDIFKKEYHNALEGCKNKSFCEAKNIFQASLVDMLQHVINLGYKIEAMPTNSGWMEIHTFDNYKEACLITETL